MHPSCSSFHRGGFEGQERFLSREGELRADRCFDMADRFVRAQELANITPPIVFSKFLGDFLGYPRWQGPVPPCKVRVVECLIRCHLQHVTGKVLDRGKVRCDDGAALWYPVANSAVSDIDWHDLGQEALEQLLGVIMRTYRVFRRVVEKVVTRCLALLHHPVEVPIGTGDLRVVLATTIGRILHAGLLQFVKKRFLRQNHISAPGGEAFSI